MLNLEIGIKKLNIICSPLHGFYVSVFILIMHCHFEQNKSVEVYLYVCFN